MSDKCIEEGNGETAHQSMSPYYCSVELPANLGPPRAIRGEVGRSMTLHETAKGLSYALFDLVQLGVMYSYFAQRS